MGQRDTRQDQEQASRSFVAPGTIAQLLAAGPVLPGDCILYRYAEPTWIQRTIARIQRRALVDLDAGFGLPSDYIHAGLVYDADSTIEMTSPYLRVASWATALAGVQRYIIVRPVDADPLRLAKATFAALRDLVDGAPYPYRELLLYWLWSWGFRKLRGKTPFSRVFRSRRRNVCSGSVIDWWQRAGIHLGLTGTDAWPEAWYPARLLVDPRFQVVATSDQPEGSRPPQDAEWDTPPPPMGDSA